MPRPPKHPRYMHEEDLGTQSDTQGLVGAQAPASVEECVSSSSTCSSSFPSSSSSSTSSSSSSSSPSPYYPLMWRTTREDFGAAGVSGLSQDSQRACSSFSAMASTSWSHSGKGSSKQRKEGSSTLQAPPEIESLSRNEIDEKVGHLVHFLLFKYKMKEPTTKAEMLSSSIQNYPGTFTVIFSEACECMQLVFGIDLKEVDPTEHSYLLVNSLGLTYDGMQSEVQGMPKTGLLIFILSIIFMKGSCVSEEFVWETLSKIGVFDGRQHCIYGDPRKLITEDFVQEQYMEYRQVPNSDPALYEFLWGPRTHAETTKMKVLEFLANIIGSDPSSFPVWYEEALTDEKKRALARMATENDDTATASSKF